MGRKNRSSSSGNPPKKRVAQQQQQQKAPIENKSRFNIFWKCIIGIGIVIAIPASIFGIYQGYLAYKSSNLTPKETHDKAYFTQGDLKPPKIPEEGPQDYRISELPPFFFKSQISNTFPKIKGVLIKGFNNKRVILIDIGGKPLACKPSDFYKGIDIFTPSFSGCTSSKLILGVKDDRIYVSVEFKDLKKEETMGVIEFNHWKLYNDNFFDFHNDDERLEVIDKQNNIVFSIMYVETSDPLVPLVQIRGYFIGESSILILPDPTIIQDTSKEYRQTVTKCISKKDPHWKEKAQKYLHYIKTIF